MNIKKKQNPRNVEVSQIKEILQNPHNKELLARLALHEARLKLHTEVTINEGGTSEALKMFFDRIRKILPKDKFSLFQSLFNYPVQTVEVTQPIFSKHFRVFDGRNPVFEYEFKKSEDNDDWDAWNDSNFWREDAWRVYREAINSIMIIDLPVEQKGDKPEPYKFFISPSEVLDIGLSRDKKRVEWIMFRPDGDKEKLAFYDAEYYRIFKTKEGTLDIISTEVESKHELGRCPANWFWWNEFSLITPYLAALDWILYFGTAKKHLDLYGAYPILWSYAQDCDYQAEGSHGSIVCDGGHLRYDGATWLHGENGLKECPACQSRKLTGAGSLIEVEPPETREDADLSNPVGMLTADTKSLDYNVKEYERLIKEVTSKTTGVNTDPIDNKAINKEQVVSGTESETNILRAIAQGFERIRKWADETVCLLRYGKESFKGCTISYGTHFHLWSELDILELYNTLRDKGTDSIFLDGIQEQYYATKYRNEPEAYKRQMILLDLDPFRHLKNGEVLNLADKGMIEKEDAMLKINLSSLIRRFERENYSVVLFGSNMKDENQVKDYSKKIDKINEVLKTYLEPIKLETNGD